MLLARLQAIIGLGYLKKEGAMYPFFRIQWRDDFYEKNEWKTTHIELPDNFVDSGFGINAAFKVDVVAFFNAVRIQGGAQTQTNTRQIWKLESIQRSSFTEETPIFVSKWKYVKKQLCKKFFLRQEVE